MVDCSITVTLSDGEDVEARLSKIRKLTQVGHEPPPEISAIDTEKTESGSKLRLTYRCKSEDECVAIILLTDPD